MEDGRLKTQAGGSEPARTSVPLALYLLLGGVISSAQLGKAFVALPLIKAEMNLGIASLS